ncbi:MAG: hypothetical protein JWO45_6 [Spartobacteria bacterium]|nr:hypothetical protein [Spartobacteria bacterium]
MAKESRRNKPPDELKMEIARSRERVSRDLRALRYELDFPGKIKRSLRQQTGAWITAAVVVGALLVVLPARRKKIYVEPKSKSGSQTKLLEAGFAVGALKFAATLLKPIVIAFVTKKVRGYAGPPESAKKW